MIKQIELHRFIDRFNICRQQNYLQMNYIFHPFFEDILKLLQKTHWITGYTVDSNKTHLRIIMKYTYRGQNVMSDIRLISTTRRHIILNTHLIRFLLNSMPSATFIVRTKHGLRTHHDCLKNNYGGELILGVF